MKRRILILCTLILTCLIWITLSGCASASKSNLLNTSEEQSGAAAVDSESEKTDTDSPEAEEGLREEDSLTASLAKIVRYNKSRGDFSAFTCGLNSEVYGVYDDHQMQAASLIKLFVAGAIYENWDEMKAHENWDSELDILLKLMITVSDNEASNHLIKKLGFGDAQKGMDVVNAYCANHGYTNTHLGRLLLASNEYDDNYTSVKDCGYFLRAVYNGEFDGSETILKLLKKQTRLWKIPAGVPEGIQTANKTGELLDVENDAAIIWGTQPYILVVMSQDLYNASSAQGSIIAISSQMYKLWESRK